MHKLSVILALTTAVAIGASVAPSLAASPTAPIGNAAPFCNSNDGPDTLRLEKSQLALELHLKTRQEPSIDDWANCLKVSYVDTDGHQVVQLYDPDSLKLIETLS